MSLLWVISVNCFSWKPLTCQDSVTMVTTSLIGHFSKKLVQLVCKFMHFFIILWSKSHWPEQNYLCLDTIVFSCDQAALQMVFSVCPSVRPSVCLSVCLSVTPFWPCSHHRIIMKFSGVITNDKSDVHAKGQGQRSKVKVTEVTTQLNRFRTVTSVWIHIWWWNDAYRLMLLSRGALLFFKVIRQISRSQSSKNRQIWARLGVSGL